MESSESVYPDGRYTLEMTAEDVAGNSTTDTKIVRVDNFIIFNKIVRFRTRNREEEEYYYNKQWMYDEEQNRIVNRGYSNTIPNQDFTIEITTSESCERLEYKIDNSGTWQNVTSDDEEDMNFHIDIDEGELTTGEHTLFMRSTDLSGNLNYCFTDIDGLYMPVLRIGNEPNDWSIPNLQGVDECHKFYITNSSNSYIANFTYEIDGNNVYFENTSEPASESWEWSFPGGTTSTEANPFIYLEDGTHIVSLTTTFADGSEATVSKEVYVGVVNPLAADFTWIPIHPQSNQDVDFECLNTNILYYDWNFGDGFGTSTDAEPTYYYTSDGVYNVTLAVTDVDYNVSELTQTIVVGDVENELYVTCHYTGTGIDYYTKNLHANLCWFNHTPPYSYRFYRNGIPIGYINHSFNSWEQIEYTFPREGDHTISVEIYDENDWFGNCEFEIQIYDPTVTDLDVKFYYNNPQVIYQNTPKNFTIKLENGLKPYRWNVEFWKDNHSVSYDGDEDDDIIEFSHTFEQIGDYIAKVYVWDDFGRDYYEEIPLTVLAYNTDNIIYYTKIDCPVTDDGWKSIVEKGSKHQLFYTYKDMFEVCGFNKVKIFKKRNGDYYRIFKDESSQLTYEADFACNKTTTFNYEDNYKLRVYFDNNNNETCNLVFTRTIISIDSEITKTQYTDGVRDGNNYYAGSFDLDEVIPNSEPVHLKAVNQIVLNPGFETADGADFIAEILESPPCQGIDKTQENQPFQPNPTPSLSNINIIPNPNNGIFAIDLFFLEAQVNKIEIMSEIGIVISTQENIQNGGTVEFDISNNAPGLYFAKIYFLKIIYQ